MFLTLFKSVDCSRVSEKIMLRTGRSLTEQEVDAVSLAFLQYQKCPRNFSLLKIVFRH